MAFVSLETFFNNLIVTIKELVSITYKTILSDALSLIDFLKVWPEKNFLFLTSTTISIPIVLPMHSHKHIKHQWCFSLILPAVKWCAIYTSQSSLPPTLSCVIVIH